MTEEKARHEFRCGCGMTHTGTIKKIAHWFDDHRGECVTNTDGWLITPPIEEKK